MDATAFELCKENVAPIAKGRRNLKRTVELLQEADECPSKLRQSLDRRRNEFRTSVKTYRGKDPLQLWIEHLKWMKDAYGTGWASGDLFQFVELACRKFKDDQRYKNDERYLEIWLDYANMCKDPSDIFTFLQANDIGQKHAAFYLRWASSSPLNRREKILEQGIGVQAEPLEMLILELDRIRSIPQRMEKPIASESQFTRPVLHSLTTSIDPQRFSSRMKNASHSSNAAPFQVFEDDEFKPKLSMEQVSDRSPVFPASRAPSTWTGIRARNKENAPEALLSTWNAPLNSMKLGDENERIEPSSAVLPFKVYEDVQIRQAEEPSAIPTPPLHNEDVLQPRKRLQGAIEKLQHDPLAKLNRI